ncbi:MAG: bifunctional oligoribonuclease/PAP phosphatase NrnA [Spirochaetota bacterium]|nr:MAG: bifunctional oligoribonuclease/PAP phosphatase NrnA [Spirochaetota bacterium]
MPTLGDKSEIWKFLLDSSSIVLTTHVRPDGDGIASELALYMILHSHGKEVYIVNQDKTPEMYSWLPEAGRIISLSQNQSLDIDSIDLTLLIDCSSQNRIGNVYDLVKNSNHIISLDHHEGNDCFRDYCYIDTTASSIGELLFSIVPDIGRYLNKEIAACLYVSIMTDTGSFAYSNTTGNVLLIASRLIEYGLNPDQIYKMIYNRKRITHFRLLGRTLQLMETDESGKVVWVLLPLSVYSDTGAVEEDTEGILEVIRGLKGLELIILLRQLDSEWMKCSLRSINSIDCSHLARIFNGGGHFKAAGFVIKGNVEVSGRSIVANIMEEAKGRGWL